MDPTGSQSPQTPPAHGRQTSYSSDGSTIWGGDMEKRDLESQSIKPVERSFSQIFGMSSPVVSANLDDIDEGDSEEEQAVDVNAPTYQRIDDHPNGYPRLAALLNSDENFLICRKYGLLHCRVLLYRQDELRELEQQLLSMDKAALKTDDTMLKCRTREDKRNSNERKELIQAIDDKLKEYHDIVQRTRAFATLQRATERNYGSVCNWIKGRAPLVDDESSTFKKDRDFVAIVDAKEGSWFDGRVENTLTALDRYSSRIGRSFTKRLFTSKHDRTSTADELVRLYDKKRIDMFSRMIITILAVILLMAPVIALFRTRNKGMMKILIIFLFTMAFSMALSLCTRAKRHEVFAATAA